MSKICGNLPCFIRVVLTPDSLPLHRRYLPRIEQVRRVERRLQLAHEIQSRGTVLVLHLGDLFLADAELQQNVINPSRRHVSPLNSVNGSAHGTSTATPPARVSKLNFLPIPGLVTPNLRKVSARGGAIIGAPKFPQCIGVWSAICSKYCPPRRTWRSRARSPRSRRLLRAPCARDGRRTAPPTRSRGAVPPWSRSP